MAFVAGDGVAHALVGDAEGLDDAQAVALAQLRAEFGRLGAVELDVVEAEGVVAAQDLLARGVDEDAHAPRAPREV